MIATGAEGELAREIGAPGLAGAKGGEGRIRPARETLRPLSARRKVMNPWLRKTRRVQARYGKEARDEEPDRFRREGGGRVGGRGRVGCT